MAILVDQRHSVASRLQGPASLLLIHSLYGSWNHIGAVPVVATMPPLHAHTGHYNLLDKPKLLDVVNAQQQISRNHTRHENTCLAASDGFGGLLDFIVIGLGSSIDQQCSCKPSQYENGDVLPKTFAEMHEESSDSNAPSRKSHLNIGGASITILPGVVYDFSDMVLHLNIRISVTVIAALMCYWAITLCGLYRFVELIQEYSTGCRCRICKDEFRIVKVIEGGSYGRILLARYIGVKRDFDFEVILKSIPIDSVSAISVTQQECRKLLSLNHRYVMKYYDDFLHREWSWNPLVRAKLFCVMVTEFCERGSLADLIEHEYSQFTEEYIINIFKKVVMALQYVHEQSVIHRDIKSPNIMLKSKDVVRLGDFGLSYTFAAKKAHKNVKCGNMLEIAAMAARNNRRRGMQQSMHMSRSNSYGDDVFDDYSGNSVDMDVEQYEPRTDDYRRTHGGSSSNRQRMRSQDYFDIPDIRVAPAAKSRTTKRVKTNRKRHNVKQDQWPELHSCDSSPQVYAETNVRGDLSPFDRGFVRRAPSFEGRSVNDQMFRNNSDSSTEQIGTRCYMAPEILMQCVYGRSSDIWALGCVLLELCSGVFMWELGYNLGDCPEKVQSLVASLPPMISRGTRSLITKMLSVDVDKRPSAAQILACRCMKTNAKRYNRGKTLGDDY